MKKVISKDNIDTLKIKLASLAVHIEEFFSSDRHINDKQAIETLLADKEVREFIDDPKNKVFLPLKRNE